MDFQYQWVCHVADELVRCGVHFFVVSPGSRNGLLVLALQEQERFAPHTVRIFVHTDERGAAYAALGYAKATQSIAAVVTTSGTAVANIFPAVLEAHYSNISLLVLSADRSWEEVGRGANQTLDQHNFFGLYARKSLDIGAPSDKIFFPKITRYIDEAVNTTISPDPGPVHINMRFIEPLYPPDIDDSSEVLSHHPKYIRWLGETIPSKYCNKPRLSFAKFSGELFCASNFRILGLIGDLVPAAANAAAHFFTKKGIPFYTELPIDAAHGSPLSHLPLYIHKIEDPQVILHLGGTFVSKEIFSYLKDFPNEHVRVSLFPNVVDPVGSVDQEIVVENLQELFTLIQGDGDKSYFQLLHDFDQKTSDLLENIRFREGDFGFFAAQNCPFWNDKIVFLGNSLPVRKFAWFAPKSSRCHIYRNRGMSGIDGLIATFAGICATNCTQHKIIILGDQSLLHDANSLSLLADVYHKNPQCPIGVLVLNNQGGHIFDYLPQAITVPQEWFDPCFIGNRISNFSGLASQFGFRYVQVHDQVLAKKELESPGLSLVELHSQEALDKQILTSIQLQIQTLFIKL